MKKFEKYTGCSMGFLPEFEEMYEAEPYLYDEENPEYLHMFVVSDSIGNHFSVPYFSENFWAGVRQFENCVLTEGHIFNTHADDFCLRYLGTFSKLNGDICLNCRKLPIRVMFAFSVKNGKELVENA